jgi:tetratricopeptide (TPR) repeat protein
MSWSRERWQTAAAIACCVIGTALLAALPRAWADNTAIAAETAATRPATATPPLGAAVTPASSAAGPAAAPVPDRPVASAENQAKALELARQAKALIDRYSGDTQLLIQASGLIESALQADGRSAEALIEQSRFTMKYGGSLSPEILAAAELPLRHSLAYHPDHGNTLVLLGYVLTHQRRYDEAAQAFDTARWVKADSPWLELNTAEMLSLQGRDEEALDHYEAAIDDPKVPPAVKDWATEQMSRLLAAMGQGDKAADAYEKLLATGRFKAWTYGHYACLLRVNLIDTQRSVEMGREALKRMNYGWGRDCLGRSLYVAWAEALLKEKNKAKAQHLYAEAQKYIEDPSVLLDEVYKYPRAHPIIEALKQKGYSLDKMPGREIGSGDTPLSMAAKNGNNAIVAQLLDNGASVDVAGYGGTTALMYAAYIGDEELILLLLNRGADPWLRDSEGGDAEAVAQHRGNTGAAQLLAAAKKDKPRSSRKAADANGLPVVGERYRTRGVVPAYGPWRAYQAGEIVVYLGANGTTSTTDDSADADLRLNFKAETEKNERLEWTQNSERLDWQKMFELAPES